MSGRAAGLILAALTLLGVALSTGAAVYFLLAAMLVSMLALAFLTALAALLSVRVTSHTPRTQVVRGDSVALRLYVRCYSVMPVSEIVLLITSPMDDGVPGRMAVNASPLKGREYRYALTCPHRGQYTVGPARVEVSDIFGLFTFRRRIEGGEAQLDVVPRTYALPPMVLSPGDTGPQMRMLMSEDAASPSDVRAWRDGDVLKKVHWKLTMRKRELIVRTYEESARPDTLILMDASPISAIRSQALQIEDALCETALSMALAQLTNDHPVRMPLVTSKPSEPSGMNAVDFPRFQDAMTHLKFDSPYPYEQVLTLEMRRMQRTGGVVLVTSKLTAVIADIALKMRRFGMQVLFIWITESARAEALELFTRLDLGGVKTRKVDPWSTHGYIGRDNEYAL